MYVAAVSPLSSGPLSLIMAISFFLGCLVCSSLSKAFLPFPPLEPTPGKASRSRLAVRRFLFFPYSISDRNSNLENR